MKRTMIRLFSLSGACLTFIGCGRAPAINVIGSYFPAWMVCLIAAITVASILRVFLLRRQWEAAIGPVALFYPTVVLLLSCVLWLIFYR